MNRVITITLIICGIIAMSVSAPAAMIIFAAVFCGRRVNHCRERKLMAVARAAALKKAERARILAWKGIPG